uniref:Uncharacterized protein n=1 Tax=Anguilla anguilla TaxID=7936 RepID=A0A0E9TGN1_ANGAN
MGNHCHIIVLFMFLNYNRIPKQSVCTVASPPDKYSKYTTLLS